MSAELTDQFRDAAANALRDGAARTVVPYRHGRKPDDHEIVRVAEDAVAELEPILVDMDAFDDLDVFDPEGAVARKAALYVMRTTVDNGQDIHLLRATSPRRRLKRTKKIPAVWSGQVFEVLEDDPVLFDDTFDAYVTGGQIYVLNQRNFERSLNFMAAAQKAAKGIVKRAIAGLSITNEKEFLDAVAGDVNMISKVRGIAERLTDPGYAAAMTTANLLQITQAHPEVDIDWVETVPGKMELVFHSDVQRRWRILKLLDDDFVQSLVTQLVYESNSKQSLT